MYDVWVRDRERLTWIKYRIQSTLENVLADLLEFRVDPEQKNFAQFDAIRIETFEADYS